MQKYIWIIIPSILTFSSTASDEKKELIAIIESDINYLMESYTKGSCFSENYLSAISQKNEITGCKENNNFDKLKTINTEITRIKNNLYNGNFSDVEISIEKLKKYKDHEINTDYLSKLQNLLSSDTYKKTGKSIEIASPGYNISIASLGLFEIDTAAGINSIDNKSSSDQKNINIIDFSGKTSSLDYLHESIFNQDELFLKRDKNYLGLSFLMKYKSIKFIKPHENRFEIPFYMDGENIFFVSYISTGKNFIEGNICIDTGSELTIGTRKLFRKNRKQLISLGVKKMSALSASGKMNSLVRIAPTIKFKISSSTSNPKTVEAYDVPILLRNSSSPSCDLILGRDVLDNILLEINFLDRTIVLY